MTPSFESQRTPGQATRIVILVCLVAAAFAAENADIQLNDGRVLKAARTVSIGEKTVTIRHNDGVISVAPDAVPLDVLARAQMALQGEEESRRKKSAEIAERAALEKEERDAARQQELQIRFAEANARAKGQGKQGQGAATRQPPNLEKQLIALKGRFPPKKMVRISIRGDCEIPNVDIWSYYRGMMQTTTVEALPKTLAILEDRLTQDLETLQKRADTASRARQGIEAEQARRTVIWLRTDLRRYLDEAKQLTQAK